MSYTQRSELDGKEISLLEPPMEWDLVGKVLPSQAPMVASLVVGQALPLGEEVDPNDLCLVLLHNQGHGSRAPHSSKKNFQRLSKLVDQVGLHGGPSSQSQQLPKQLLFSSFLGVSHQLGDQGALIHCWL